MTEERKIAFRKISKFMGNHIGIPIYDRNQNNSLMHALDKIKKEASVAISIGRSSTQVAIVGDDDKILIHKSDSDTFECIFLAVHDYVLQRDK